MVYWFFFLLLQPGLSIKILTFESSSSGEISYDFIQKSMPLPDIFTICSAFKESLIYDYNSFFAIFGDDGESWMTLGNFVLSHISLWLYINKEWIKITDMPEHMMNSWIHVCVMTDTISGNISLLVNGNPPVLFTVHGLAEHKPDDLKGKLYLGKSEDLQKPKQYQGEVGYI